MVHELCDESRFKKGIVGALAQIRNGVHDGLFTAALDEPNWGLAHRVLTPAFGPMPIQNMFTDMHELAAQLTLKWARHGTDTPIMVTDDFTRLALDTIALCSMDFRFNSFYHDALHPFIDAMANFLVESNTRSEQPGFVTMLKRGSKKKYWKDIETLRQTAQNVVDARKRNPSTDRKDLLTAMLEGVDPKTGKKLSDSSIIDNLITFLIAGHETTSGMLSFTFYLLLKNPATYRKAQQEVDNIVGTGPIKHEHINKLPYLSAVLRETLRLHPTIPMMGVQAINDDIVGGKYAVKKGQDFALLLAASHLDPKVFGETAKDFIPERMLDDSFNQISKDFPDFWKPFGNGVRGCIGRPFAWQESVLILAMLLQNLDFCFDDPSYELQYKQTLTTKPLGFFMRASIRHGMSASDLALRLGGQGKTSSAKANGVLAPTKKSKQQREGKPLNIYYGSNSGTCEALAQRMAAGAALHGFAATVVDVLDSAKAQLPRDRPVAIITASYEGQPPDNAAEFYKWVEGLGGNELDGVSYAVFGCGHRDWAQTYHRVPKFFDATVEARGGLRLCEIGLTDAAEGQMFSDFEQWEDDVFWPAAKTKYGVSEGVEGDGGFASRISVQFSSPRSSALRQDVKEAVVVEARSLTAPEAREKRHLEVQLPTGMTYRSGDYLAVLPINPIENVQRVMRRFHLPLDSNITIESEGQTRLPTNLPVPVYDILASYVELAQPATKRVSLPTSLNQASANLVVQDILALAEATQDATIKAELQALSGPKYTADIAHKRVSALDLLERFPSVSLPFDAFLSLLPPMRVRQYSISSSPLRDPSRATLTYSLLSEPSLANPNLRHVGVASSYLSTLTASDKLNISVRPSHAAFHLPAEPEKTPIICIAAGAGLAPFRGFTQERAAQIAAGRQLAPALLFFGCRDPKHDDIYREEFDKWERMGAVSIRRAYSRAVDKSDGCRYVQDRLWQNREDLMKLWDANAKIYVCGSRNVAEGVKKMVVRIAVEMHRLKKERGETAEELDEQGALKWFEGIRNERYATDVFD